MKMKYNDNSKLYIAFMIQQLVLKTLKKIIVQF